ncbi:MAG: hypothetical protein U0869_21980 [Chloroflexota bacterium]
MAPKTLAVALAIAGAVLAAAGVAAIYWPAGLIAAGLGLALAGLLLIDIDGRGR